MPPTSPLTPACWRLCDGGFSRGIRVWVRRGAGGGEAGRRTATCSDDGARVDGQRRERDVRLARAARQGARETKPLDVVGRVYSQTVGSTRAVRRGWETGADALPCAGRRVGRRARSTRSSPWSWCVRFARRSSSYGAAADEAGELGRERQRQIPNEPFFVRTCFSSQESLRTCACVLPYVEIDRILRGSHWPRR